MGERLYSVDLDLYATPKVLGSILGWAPANGVRIVKSPIPRALPVAVLDSNDEQVNILTQTPGLPPPELAHRASREFYLEVSDLTVLVADPLDLLANKLAVHRDKDLPHIEILERFVREEIVQDMQQEERPRNRISLANRYLDVRRLDALPVALFERLVPHARLRSDHRFLFHRAPDAAAAARIRDMAVAAEYADLAAWMDEMQRRPR